MSKKLIILFFFIAFTTEASAYLGPGMGGGIVAATVGIIVAILVAIFGIIWFPIKRLLKKRKDQKNQEQAEKEDNKI